jgi:hypothetical protein
MAKNESQILALISFTVVKAGVCLGNTYLYTPIFIFCSGIDVQIIGYLAALIFASK